MKAAFPLVSLTAFLMCHLSGGTAAFFADGLHLVRTGENSLTVLSLETRIQSELRWPEGAGYEYPAVAWGDARLLVGGGNGISSYDPGTKTWKVFWNAPEGISVSDIAYDRKNRVTVVVAGDGEGSPDWWIFSGNNAEPVKLFNRRAPGAACPAFDSAGILYFTVAGDLWKGGIQKDDDPETPFILHGKRTWPLASLETDGGNSSGLSGRQIMPLGKWIVLELSRTGGSGWGDIIRIPNQDAYEKQLPLKWDELADCGTGSDAAVSEDGKAAVYIHGAGKWFDVDPTTGALSPLETKEAD